MAEVTGRRTTGVSRRHGPFIEELGFPSRFYSEETETEPATTVSPPRPHGDLSRASVDQLASLAHDTWEGQGATCSQRARAVRAILRHLLEFPGDVWQERWDASPLGRGEVNGSDVGTLASTGIAASTGVRTMFCLRVVQPSNLAFRSNAFQNYPEFFIQAQADPLLEKFVEFAVEFDAPWQFRRDAIKDLCDLLTIQGVALGDVTHGALLHHAHETRRVRAGMLGPGQAANRFVGRSTWDIMQKMGLFPDGTPPTMRIALTRGPRSIEQLVDRYAIGNRAVRQLLIDYFTRRAADLDYASLKTLVLTLAHHFWEKIERINPGQADLRISPQTYRSWRQTIITKDDGTVRTQQDSIVIAVRSFYYDLHTWAADEPELWGAWVAPCPVPPTELRGLGKRRRRINERSADRTRQRQPLLPLLVEYVETRYDHTRLLLDRARQADEGEAFVLDRIPYQRVVTDTDRKRNPNDPPPPRVLNQNTGEILNVEVEEETAFWSWACVETLRHSGIRIEELSELTHLSIRQYQRPNGEVIALLVIAPSKTDRERVIPMSTELFHVIAAVVRRHTQGGRSIPRISRYDPHDKVWSAELPFLFQRQTGTTSNVFTSGTVITMLERCGQALAERHPAFKTVRFTPHDFRRIFATELVNSGLPIHIGAALLGHLNIQTTRGYVAIFDEDVIAHYTNFLAARRAIRPTDEYRSAGTEEWQEFEEHFDKRKVELGSCGRPYGTPCQHEHACIRCPVLHVNPKMLARLTEIEADLLDRRARAEAEAWLGEIEGIDLTLTFLRAKREDAQRRADRPTVSLGIPSVPETGKTAT
ncbi:site-specific integrase [Actinomadura oligospora]|uniref:site-specific integrase n=1 Tax=Actinomadura oligospora TaxID=111804 RepID=UPI00047D4BB8|nr:site-specific integrase [Actinomadura oligospora]